MPTVTQMLQDSAHRVRHPVDVGEERLGDHGYAHTEHGGRAWSRPADSQPTGT
ncbi:hypothetical protein [Frankia tisae]|uniref:hypothetical protein n=1 Tax=Frankia tisae TaxID=2950104 RepID=UPI0022286836|nr:hypothetical protein [Frankia tisae]